MFRHYALSQYALTCALLTMRNDLPQFLSCPASGPSSCSGSRHLTRHHRTSTSSSIVIISIIISMIIIIMIGIYSYCYLLRVCDIMMQWLLPRVLQPHSNLGLQGLRSRANPVSEARCA